MTLYYVAFVINHTIDISVGDAIARVPISFANGMIGAVPVFDTLESAKEYAGERGDVAVFEGKREEQQ